MYLQLLKNKNCVYYLMGGGISKLGDVLSGLAFLFMAYDLTGSKLHTTGILLAETIPYLLFGLIGGVIADWVNKRKLLIMIDLIRIPIVFSVVILSYFDHLSYVYLLFISFLIQCLGSFFNPGHRALLPIITPVELRTAANSLFDSISRGVTVLSPFLSVFFLKTIGVIHFFTIDAATYLLSALFLFGIHAKEKVSTKQKRKISTIFIAIKDFMIWSKDHRMIKKLFVMTFIIVFFNTWVWQAGLLLLLKEMTKQSETIYSMMQGLFGLAVIIVNMIIPFVFKKMTMSTYLIGSFICGLGIIFIGFSHSIEFFFIGVFIVGLGMPLSGLSRVFLLQQLVPEDKLGRGFSFNAVLLYLGNTLSLMVFGFLSIIVPTDRLFLICGLIMILASIIALIFLPAKLSKVRRSHSI